MLTLCVCTNLVIEEKTDVDRNSMRKVFTSNSTRSSLKDIERSQYSTSDIVSARNSDNRFYNAYKEQLADAVAKRDESSVNMDQDDSQS